MEEERTSTSISISSTEREESNSTSSVINRQRKHGGIRSSRSKYKGVVPQQNGHWGAQIYADHQRIWLGTFKTEDVAALAYDRAAIKLRPLGNLVELHRNFPDSPLTRLELNFQAHYTIEQVLNMIKDHSYQSKFRAYLASISYFGNEASQSNQSGPIEGYLCEELFRKELTPSDVGKLNRLVIPKRHALTCLSNWVSDGVRNLLDSSLIKGGEGSIELIFYDKSMNSWKFRFCYWKSSQSYVFTRGWNKFIKEKELKAKDIVAFYECHESKDNNGDQEARRLSVIDVVTTCNDDGSTDQSLENSGNRAQVDDEKERKEEEKEEDALSNKDKERKEIWLFGVDISTNE